MNGLKKALVLSILTPALFLSIGACSSRDKKTFSEAAWVDQVEKTRTEDLYAPHFEDGRYFSPWMRMPDKSFLDVLGWKLFSKTEFTREEQAFLPKVMPDAAERVRQTRGDFILWIGHNTFLIRIGKTLYITDPMFSQRALLPSRLTPPALSLEEMKDLAADNLNILISHNHYDHLDKAGIQGLSRVSNVFVPQGLKSLVLDMGARNVTEMDWWDEILLPDGARLICLPAQHWSMRIDQGRNRSLWASYLLITPAATLYFGGDSGYFKGYREFGRKFPGIDYAFLPTTAYHPRWFMHFQHMDTREAVRAFEELQARFFIPTQWGTFHLGSEPAGVPGLDLMRLIRENNLNKDRFKIPAIGEILPIDTQRKNDL